MKVIHEGFKSYTTSSYELPSYPLDFDYRKESDVAVSSEWKIKGEYSKGYNTLLECVKRIAYYIYLGLIADD